jgi:cyclophilin family peptidyl-prolyl cis-trans isomerase
MVADTGSCTNPSFSTSSTPGLAVLNCKVTATGTVPISIKSANGDLLYAGALMVPQPQVTLKTSMGDIVLDLDPTAAPLSVNNFLQYVSANFYTHLIFHRVVPGFVIQVGGYDAALTPALVQSPIPLESNNGLLNVRGALAMARTNVPDSATSQFFINVADNPSLDYVSATQPGYAVFGKVASGLPVVDSIAAVPTGVRNGMSDVPLTDVVIVSAAQTR